MNPSESCCEIATFPGAATGSRVLRFRDFRWESVPVDEYKAAADHWRGVTRQLLVGGAGEATGFHVRYFELAPGGFTTLEHHAHTHAVFVIRGKGEVRLGDADQRLGFGDTVYVAPDDMHQFRNTSDAEAFGFLCIVDARRDRPVARTGDT